MNRNKIRLGFLATLCGSTLLLGTSCSDEFRNINTDETHLTPDMMKRDNFQLGAFFPQMQEMVNPCQENSYQMDNNLIGDVYGRYLTITNDGWKSNFATFNAPEGWINYPFNDVFTKVYSAWIFVKKETKGQGPYYAWAQILRVAAFHRITDMYGPIPYSKVNEGAVSVAYDSQEDVYKAMFIDLTDAINVLTEFNSKNPGYSQIAPNDEVYAGNLEKWIKYANSLKLRMAMRIVYADPVLAKKMAEEAVNHPIGVMKNNDDNAMITYPKNPIYIVGIDWGDTRVCADIVAYMQGYQDPRISKYFQKGSINGQMGFYGLRAGINIISKSWADNYSAPVVNPKDRLLWMNAAEVAFLRAEGAMRGWEMGGTDEDLYNEGIKLSFEQHGAGSADAYLNNSTLKPCDYVDPNVLNSEPAHSTITIKWNSAAGIEANLERIITQKWIAMWPLGQEAWSEFRRTGYPKLMPVKVNKSSEPNLTTELASRIPYPPYEMQHNKENYDKAVILLGGEDKYGTRLWWDKKTK